MWGSVNSRLLACAATVMQALLCWGVALCAADNRRPMAQVPNLLNGLVAAVQRSEADVAGAAANALENLAVNGGLSSADLVVRWCVVRWCVVWVWYGPAMLTVVLRSEEVMWCCLR